MTPALYPNARHIAIGYTSHEMESPLLARRRFLQLSAGAAAAGLAAAPPRPPNIVMIYVDDLGYGDLGCYGSNIRTPNLDRMAAEGVRFTQFYSANPVCSPARAALLTGRYPTRTGVPNVIMAPDKTGLSPSETTLAALLKPQGYKTMCIGKWHLGHQPQYLPTNRGFDEYYGIPYSNDMTPRPLMHNTEVLEEPAVLETLTPRYTQQALQFIERSKDSPFFLYMPHTFPHIPLAASPRFRGKSPLGLYGDVVEELDWSVGEVLAKLKQTGLDNQTLVMFSSDNGPWYQGSPGQLRGRKGSTYEGGVREPFLARFPGRIPRGDGLPWHRRHHRHSAHSGAPDRRGPAETARRWNRYLAAALRARVPAWNAKPCSISTAGTCSARAWESGNSTSPATTLSRIARRPPAAESICRCSTRSFTTSSTILRKPTMPPRRTLPSSPKSPPASTA